MPAPPPPTSPFLQLLFGHRSLDELEEFYPGCFTRDDHGRALVNTPFPKQPSLVWGII